MSMYRDLLNKFYNTLYNFVIIKDRIYPQPNVKVEDYTPGHGGREYEVQMGIVSDFILKRLIPVTGINPYPLNELSLMVSAVCWIRPSHVFEWGTYRGTSARIFYETAKYFKIPCEVHSIDLPDGEQHIEHPGDRRGELVRSIKEVKLYEGDGAPTALAILESSVCIKAPLFFIDGEHSYESVIRELNLIYDSVRDANFLVHDTLYQSEESNYNVGPSLAVRDFLSGARNEYRRVDTHLGLPGMTLLYKVNAGAVAAANESIRITGEAV